MRYYYYDDEEERKQRKKEEEEEEEETVLGQLILELLEESLETAIDLAMNEIFKEWDF